MYETKSSLKYCQDIVEEFNNSSNEWQAKVLGFFTKNMSLHCETIMIKKKGCFNESLRVDYWDKGFFDIEVPQDFNLMPFERPLSLLEQISKKEIQITRT